MAEETSKRIVTVQGYMSVESKALDDAFADTDVDPRQRLVSLEIDYLDDAIDVARCTFVDPDGRVGQAIRVGSTKIGDKLVYTPWTARIGYFGQEPEEMTSLTGVPMMEASNFPEDGEPVITIKVMSPSIALQKNTTPTGNVNAFIGPDGDEHPLKRAITEISQYYGLGTPVWGDSGMEEIIGKVDDLITGRLNLDHLDRILYGNHKFSWKGAPSIPSITYNYSWGRATYDSNDAKYLTRIAGALKKMMDAIVEEPSTTFDEFFSKEMLGNPSKSDIKIVWGIYNNQFIFMFVRDYLKLLGLNKIPCLDYRVGNNLLRSFNPRTESTKAQSGVFARIFAGAIDGDSVSLNVDPPEIEKLMSSDDDIAKNGINSLSVDKYLSAINSLPDNSAASSVVDIDALRRSLDTDVKGEAATYGDKHLVAGNLVCLNGLPYGPMVEPEENEAQVFATYNRIYLIKQATHRMDDTGFYSAKLKVEGCSMDGSDETALANLMKRLQGGIEGGAVKAGFWDFLIN